LPIPCSGLQSHVLAAGQQRVERRLLQRRADRGAHLWALLDDVEAGHPRRPFGRRQQRRQHQHRGRLAGAIGTEESVDLAGLDPQVDAVDRPRPVLELANERFDFDALLPLCCHHNSRLSFPREAAGDVSKMVDVVKYSF
jgi:hypothetical protein